MHYNIVSDKTIDMPLFSIITVCLNAGESLLQTIESILMQDFPHFQLIVKDGFSTDGSFEKTPCDARILKVQERDVGIYDAMNQALKYAKGQYVLFLNAGDFFYDKSVLQTFSIAYNSNKTAGLIYCDYITTGINERVHSPQKLTNFFLFRTMLCHQVCMIKRECFDRIGFFNIEYKVDADYDFLLRLIICHKTQYVYIPMLGIISTSNGFSSKNRTLAEQEVKIIRQKYFPKTYCLYHSLLFFTLPSLRKKIASQPGVISRYYIRLVNLINE